MGAYHQLVRLSPNTLLAYFTQLWKLVIISIPLPNYFITAKNTYISDILVEMCSFPGIPPCADIIASFWLEEEKLTFVSK